MISVLALDLQVRYLFATALGFQVPDPANMENWDTEPREAGTAQHSDMLNVEQDGDQITPSSSLEVTEGQRTGDSRGTSGGGGGFGVGYCFGSSARVGTEGGVDMPVVQSPHDHSGLASVTLPVAEEPSMEVVQGLRERHFDSRGDGWSDRTL